MTVSNGSRPLLPDQILIQFQSSKIYLLLLHGLVLSLYYCSTWSSAVAVIEADQPTVIGKLHALISRWVKSTTQPNQWITLVEAIVMCDEPTVARDLATAVGVDYPPHSGKLY